MLLVEAEVKPSTIEGSGLFACQFIKRGTLVWRFEPGLDVMLDRAELLVLPPVARKYLRHYAYLNQKTDKYILCFDNAKYFNHSSTPNTRNVEISGQPESVDIAVRDIYPGEELTTDYAEFDAAFREKLVGVAGISGQSSKEPISGDQALKHRLE